MKRHRESRISIQGLRLPFRWLAWLCFAVGIWGATIFHPVAAEDSSPSPMVRYFDQLRQRRLFSVAEQLGIDRLASAEISAEDEILLSVELSKTYAEHARFTSGEEHEQYWLLAEEVLDEALSKHREHPRGLYLEAQRAFVPGERGEFLRGQVELFPYDKGLRAQTDEIFKTAIDRLKSLETNIARMRRGRMVNRQRGSQDLAAYEFQDLHAEIRFRLASALQESAKIRASFDRERTRLLQEAHRWWDILGEAHPSDPFRQPAKIRLAENYRLRDDLIHADAVLKELEEERLSEELLTDLVMERVRWMIAKGQLTEAVKRLDEPLAGAWRKRGELDFLKIQILAALWRSAEAKLDDATSNQLIGHIERKALSLQTEVGGYWAYRANLLREQLQKARKYGSQVAAIIERAEARYAGGETNAAAEDYRLAAELALKRGDVANSFELGYTRASILVQLKNFDEAAKGFRQLVGVDPQNPQTPEAHLLEAYCLGKIYEQDSTQLHREAYADCLTQHTEAYPDHPTTGDAFWMLGQHEENRRQITLAIKYYREVPGDHRRALAAHLAVARCYQNVLKRLDELKEKAAIERAANDEERQLLEKKKSDLRAKTLEWENAAATELSQLLKGYPKEPEPLSSGQGDVALQLARMQLTRTQPAYAAADSVLERILVSGAQKQSGAPATDDPEQTDWSRILKTARQLRIVSLAGQGLSNRAQQLVQQLANSSTEDVLGVMDGLTQVAGAANLTTRQKLGQLQLQTALELNRRRDQLAATEQDRLDHCLAQAYLAINRLDEALTIYNQMIANQPKNNSRRQRIADILGQTENRKCLLKAKQHWRILESQQKPGSIAWLELRYQVARTSHKLGETEECRKLLGVTSLLYPQLGNAELRGRYEALQNEVGK